MLNNKLYKPTLLVDGVGIHLMNSKILTGMCSREIIVYQNKLDINSLAHKQKIATIYCNSIKKN